MLTTVKAEIDVRGNIRLLEPLEVFKTTKALFTLLDDNGNGEIGGSAKSVLDFLRANRLSEGSRPTPEEIDAQIEETRNSWD
ncbi:MAG TPA: hypothetical protein VK612_10050 [Pyrinomonadaceae bacterium]|nr:hypothetical protein [Pyrinomonadaceae bacterium]